MNAADLYCRRRTVEPAQQPVAHNQWALNGVVASIAHLAYHLGAMRQIDGAARGPTAEDEARAGPRVEP